MKLGQIHGPMDYPVGKSGHKYILRVPKRKFSKNQWRVMIPLHGKRKTTSRGGLQKNIGYFVTIKEAIAARDTFLKANKV